MSVFSDMGWTLQSGYASSMPTGLIRYQQCGEMHLLTIRCYRRLPYLGDANAKSLSESASERIRKRYRFVVAGCPAFDLSQPAAARGAPSTVSSLKGEKPLKPTPKTVPRSLISAFSVSRFSPFVASLGHAFQPTVAPLCHGFMSKAAPIDRALPSPAFLRAAANCSLVPSP